jgi:AcrR family transcriptional regulator
MSGARALSSPRTTRRSPDATREAILDAALELFAERTFHGCAVPQIAERAGVATGSIYRHFTDKEALVNAVYQRWKGELRRRLIDDAPPTTTIEDELHNWWQALCDFVDEHPTAYTFLQAHHHEPYLDDASRDVGYAIDAAALELAQRSSAAGALGEVDPALAVALVLGAFDGVVRVRTLYPDALPADALAQAEQLVLRLLAATTPEGNQPISN